MTTENQGETDSTSGGEEIFPGGIRVEQSRRRPLVGDEAEASGTPVTASSDSDDKPSLVVRHNEPRPAVPPSAGGAHRSAVYRTAPDEPMPSEAPAEAPAEASEPDVTAAPAASAEPETPAAPEGGQTMADQDDSKKLLVGRGISLKGEISNCDALVVEGTVEANLAGCRTLNIGESGIVTGQIEVEEAIVAGRFKGSLTVREVLSIKSTGRVRGEVRYGSLQVDSGGVLAGSADTSTASGGDDDEDETPASSTGGTFGMRTTAPGGGD